MLQLWWQLENAKPMKSFKTASKVNGEEVAKDKNSIYVFKIALPGSPLSDCLTVIRDSGLFIFILLNLNVGIILKLAGPLKIYYHL